MMKRLSKWDLITIMSQLSIQIDEHEENYAPVKGYDSFWSMVSDQVRKATSLLMQEKYHHDTIISVYITKSMHRNYDLTCKVVLVGPTSCGKSAILRRYADGTFDSSLLPTIGVDFRFKSMTVDGQFIKLQLWDTAGQERFKNITHSYYRDADAVIMVYDVNEPNSLYQLQGYWLPSIRSEVQPHTLMYVFGNKCDRGEMDAEAVEWCEREGLSYCATSAKEGTGIERAIDAITKQIIEVKPKEDQGEKLVLSLKEVAQPMKKKQCC